VPRIASTYYSVVSDINSDYDVGGVQDPFLQVAILRFLRAMRKRTTNANFMKYFSEILVSSYDGVSPRGGNALKNSAYAILFECFQCFMTIPPNSVVNSHSEMVLTKFVSIKDANSKYLSLFSLALMAQSNIAVVRKYKNTIVECLGEDDLLIRTMTLNLLYVIASPENVGSIIKELLNVLLIATDEEFITELSLKVLPTIFRFA
jgi:AP-1 complex subunit gamma-1